MAFCPVRLVATRGAAYFGRVSISLSAVVVAGLLLTWTGVCPAQTEYHDLQGGRPTYIEDASVTARYAFEWEMAPVSIEHFGAGLTRFEVEPQLSYGLLPRTDVEITTPFVFREHGATPTNGLTGFGLGAAHTFNTESVLLPAFAVKGNIVFPGAGATTFGTLYALRAIATRAFGALRLHLNVAYSNYNVAVPAQPTSCGGPCPSNPPPIPDMPCAVTLESAGSTGASGSAPAIGTESTHFIPGPPSHDVGPTQSSGTLLVLGMAADHALPLASLLFAGDVYVTRYSGQIARPSDWTADLGFRKQLSPRLVLDVGAGRRFEGLRVAWIVTVGTSYTFAIPALTPEGQPDAARR